MRTYVWETNKVVMTRKSTKPLSAKNVFGQKLSPGSFFFRFCMFVCDTFNGATTHQCLHLFQRTGQAPACALTYTGSVKCEHTQKSNDRPDLYAHRRRCDNFTPFEHNEIIKMLGKAIIRIARSKVYQFLFLYFLLLFWAPFASCWIWEERTQTFFGAALALAESVKEAPYAILSALQRL